MSAFKQNTRKLGIRAGLLAGASAAVLAIGGVSAGSAMAAPPNCTPEGIHIKGMGSSLQKVAQTIWTGREVKNVTTPSEVPTEGTANAEANSFREKCAVKTSPPTVTYGSSGSGKGLAAFGFSSAKTLNPELAFVGSDDGPTQTLIEDEETASGAKPIILPVSQTAIAVMVHLPAGCTLEKITWQDLNRVWGGSKTGGTGIKTWREFSTASPTTVGGACDHEITRVVRKEGSGTTLQFKNYLSTLATTGTIGAEQLPCTTEGHTTWAELEEVGPTEEKPNVTWPQCTGGTPVFAAEGGGKVAEKVETTANTIGYAALPDAEAHMTNVQLEKLQTFEAGTSKEFAEPVNTTTKTARCTNARYSVPEAGRRGVGTGEAVNWSTVFGAKPEIGGTTVYPLCTLTFVAGLSNYTEAKYGVNHTKIGEVVADYIKNYVISTAATQGQAAVEGHYYSKLPVTGGAGSETDVQDSAEFIATKLG